MSSPSWDSIPLLALKCILEHLSDQEALAAMSTCRHWRSAMLLFEGHRELLVLHVNEIEKCNFLTRLYKKHMRKLHIYLDAGVSDNMLSAFVCYVLPQIFDSIMHEIIFVGPIYTSQDRITPEEVKTRSVQLRRILAEILLRPIPFLEKLAIFGCDMNFVDEQNNVCMHHQNNQFYEPLADKTLQPFSPPRHHIAPVKRCNINLMRCSKIKHLVFEYELLSTAALATLSRLDHLRLITLNIMDRTGLELNPINWAEINPLFNDRLEVIVNIISVPVGKFQHVMENALCGGMPLTTLKVMFCEVLSMRLICHVSQQYHSTLREFLWVDAPSSAKSTRLIRLHYGEDLGAPFNHVNPFIFLAWQCQLLRKIVVHGYWVCEYDLLGIIRLRKGIELDVSAVYTSTAQFDYKPHQVLGCVIRVLSYDTPTPGSKNNPAYLLREADDKDKLSPWHPLPRGLQAVSTQPERTDYIVEQATSSG